MAHHRSAKKRDRQRIVRTERNRAVRSAVRNTVRKVRTAIESGDRIAAEAGLKDAIRTIDRAAQKGVVPKPRASRVISRLTLAVNRLAKAPANQPPA